MSQEALRAQRLRYIDRRVPEINAAKEQFAERFGANIPLDISAQITNLDLELANLLSERMRLTAPELTPEVAKEYIDRMWDMMSRFETRMPVFERRLAALETRLTDWFAREAKERAAGRRVNNAFRAALLALVAADIAAHVVLHSARRRG